MTTPPASPLSAILSLPTPPQQGEGAGEAWRLYLDAVHLGILADRIERLSRALEAAFRVGMYLQAARTAREDADVEDCAEGVEYCLWMAGWYLGGEQPDDGLPAAATTRPAPRAVLRTRWPTPRRVLATGRAGVPRT